MSATILPDENALTKASKLSVLDSKGEKVLFGSIFEKEKVIIVFIRHFFCGNCQAYVTQLAAVPQDSLDKADTKLVVIGCGEWQPIQSYAESTGFQGPIFADPTRQLYQALGMNIETLAVTPGGETKRSYIASNRFTNAVVSFWKGSIKNPSFIGKQGNLSQLGGDFVFGPGLACSFAYRMQHTEDHIEVSELMKAAGVTST